MLVIKDLVVSYGPVRALHGVSLNVPEGKLICVIGSNGAGKTTLLRTISGVLKPNSGSIKLGDNELVGVKPHLITRRGVAHCPEGRRVFPDQSVTDNLVLGAFSCIKRIGHAEMQRDMESIFQL